MTHEEIVAAIERLRELLACSNRTTGSEIVGAIVGYLNTDDACDKLIELLEQADPDTHRKLPVDANGEYIHIGDELCGYGRPDGGVYCKATNGYMVFVGEDGECAPDQWMVWDPDNCAHYHRLTVEDVLVDYYEECRLRTLELGFVTNEDKEKVRRDIAATFANKIREVMAEE
jgi:hypothetical protein